MVLTRLRTPGLEKAEQAIVDYFTPRLPHGFSERLKEEIAGSLAVYLAPTIEGGAHYGVAYDRGGAEFPTFLAGWEDTSLEEVEWGLSLVRKGIDLIMCPATFVVSPAYANPPWVGWGAKGAKCYFDHFLVLGLLSSQ